MGNLKSVPQATVLAPESSEQQVVATAMNRAKDPQAQRNRNDSTTASTSNHTRFIRSSVSNIRSAGIRRDNGHVDSESYQSADQKFHDSDRTEQEISRDNLKFERLLHLGELLDDINFSSEDEIEISAERELVVATGEEGVENDSQAEKDENGSEHERDGLTSRTNSSDFADCMMDSDLSWSSEESLAGDVGFNEVGTGEENLHRQRSKYNRCNTEEQKNNLRADEESDIEADLNYYSEEEEEEDKQTDNGVLLSDIGTDLNCYEGSKETSSPDKSKNIDKETKSKDLERQKLDREALMLYESYWNEHCQGPAEEKLKKTDTPSDNLQLKTRKHNQNEDMFVPVLDEDQIYRLSEECRSRAVHVKLNALQFRGSPGGHIEWISTHEGKRGQVHREVATSKQCPLVKHLVEQYELELLKQKYGRERSSSSDAESVSDFINKCIDSVTESGSSSATLSIRFPRTTTILRSHESNKKNEVKPELLCPYRGEMCAHKAAEPCPFRIALIAKRKEKIKESKRFKPLKRTLTKRIRLPIPPDQREEHKCQKCNSAIWPGEGYNCTCRVLPRVATTSAGRVRVPAKIFRMDTYSFQVYTEPED